MPGAKKTFLDELDKQPQQPPLIRGKGVTLSTQQPEPTEGGPSVNTDVHKSVETETKQSKGKGRAGQVERARLGNAIRKDLLFELKRIAVEDRRYDYEVMEEAIEEYIARRKGGYEAMPD
jgi:hypothetical protein